MALDHPLKGSRASIDESVVAHHRLRWPEPELREVRDRPLEHRRCGGRALIVVLLDVGVAGAIVDDAMKPDVAGAAVAVGLGAVALGAVPGAFKARQACDVDVEQGPPGTTLITAIGLTGSA